MILATTALVAFPVRYYKRHRNPYRVAKMLVLSNMTLFVAAGFALAVLGPRSLVAEGDSRSDLFVGLLFFGPIFAAISFVIFVILSKVRARRTFKARTAIL